MYRWLVVLLGVGLLGTAWAGCEHRYFPVREGWVWTYKSSLKGKTHTVRFTGVSPLGFTYVTQLESGTVETHWKCDVDGLTSLEFAASSLGGKTRQVNFKTVNRKGVVIPNNLGVGSSWSYSFTLEGEMDNSKLTNNMETSNKVVGLETVTVPAGTFKAVRIESTSTMKMSMNMGGKAKDLPANVVQSISWYADGVGLVKSVAADITTELVSLKK